MVPLPTGTHQENNNKCDKCAPKVILADLLATPPGRKVFSSARNLAEHFARPHPIAENEVSPYTNIATEQEAFHDALRINQDKCPGPSR